MGVLNYILISIVTAIAFPVGFYLAKIAKEELKPGKKYIQFLFPTFFALVLLFTSLSYSFHPIIIVFIVIACMLAFYYIKIHNLILYFILALELCLEIVLVVL